VNYQDSNMKDKAIVIKTGEVLDVEGYFTVMNLTISLPIEISDDVFKQLESEVYLKSRNQDNPKPGDYYTLSDGNKYNDDELIVGLDNIREYKIKKII